MRKILVIGINGSGKSVFARKLGEKIKLPVFHLDKLFHKPNWQKTPNDEWDQVIDNLVKKEKWIIDGMYLRTLEKRLKAADTIIFLDFPKWLALYRAVKRRIIHRDIKRPDLPEFLPEKLSLRLINKILFFNRRKVLKKIQENSNGKKILIFKNSKDIKRFLDDL